MRPLSRSNTWKTYVNNIAPRESPAYPVIVYNGTRPVCNSENGAASKRPRREYVEWVRVSFHRTRGVFLLPDSFANQFVGCVVDTKQR